MSGKYRQAGYQDSDANEPRERQRPPRQELSMEEKIQRRSMRKATNREANEVVRCHACGRNLTDVSTLSAQSTCPFCRAALHCCRGCTHFDSSARRQCRADIPAAISDKGKANTCAQFSPRLVLDFTGRRGTTRSQGRPSNDPRSQFEDLFRR